MHTENLTKKFTQMGARVKVTEATRRRGTTRRLIALDVQNDRSGEYFEISQPPGSDADVQVLDVQPKDRHLLLIDIIVLIDALFSKFVFFRKVMLSGPGCRGSGVRVQINYLILYYQSPTPDTRNPIPEDWKRWFPNGNQVSSSLKTQMPLV